MRLPIVIAAAAGVVLFSSGFVLAADVEGLPDDAKVKLPYAERCLRDLQAFDEKLEQVGFGVLPPGGYGAEAPSGYYVWGVEATPREKIHALREAAYVYAMSGEEKSCQTVLASMRQVFEQHQKLVGPEADEPDVRRAWRRAHLARAEPVTQMNHLMRADVLIGSELRNTKDEKLGEIKDIVLNPEKHDILYVLAARGGFLGFGEELVAIPWSALRATEDHELYVLDVPVKAMEDAPKVGRHNFKSTADAGWRRSLSAYWQKALKQ
ncbi:Sporulation protein YlmC, PRC-barrel domain family [Tistlia consotensis]|uniref:Sporulation protein YlmC, PRC-barrel domain family n=2 Tax=Tistlia TaxID=1321364 RepID=A0A1Y6C0V9_9PROT|nr:Sporulation protein YlmC, PRC-barrel domain family [Tistlia consotensis USBA 355]SNR65640.1 Sporulation protein YlmC, PRC-barrel domain family [Tistlia consotensis]